MMRSVMSRVLRDTARVANPIRAQTTIRVTTSRSISQLSSHQTRTQSILASARSLTRSRASQIKSRHYSTNKPAPDVTSQLGSPAPKLGLKDKLKELFKKYGYLSVGVYLALSALDFPFCFLAVRLAGPERIGQLENRILSTISPYTAPVWHFIEPVAGPVVHASKAVLARMWRGIVITAGYTPSDGEHSEKNGAASIWTQLAIAYGIHKTLLIFLRVPLTAALTPRIARSLQKRGWKIGSSSSST
ncbi:hypothetical protein AMS68_003421 [Peltaster fructicola]|uniref:DUF1279 domain-containing protein n=1 Tax=Peltaster fructicola TaxID=286661 RepID=A0A6H0XT42_9PEZI|nr:hypothetical protein AMS68_003421 [Peltaster fructicola]